MTDQITLPKGFKLEESLRSYFLMSDVYVMRGAPFILSGEEITDIDLWLYLKASPFSRERIIVDIKNKKSPKALERISWVVGIKQAIQADKAIVATTDTRHIIKQYADLLDITLLDGHFLKKLSENNSNSSRISEEYLNKMVHITSPEWANFILQMKSKLISNLGFNSCNLCLIYGEKFASSIFVQPKDAEIILRLLYLTISYIALSIDFASQKVAFLPHIERQNAIHQGLTFGDKGEKGITQIINQSIDILSPYVGNLSGQRYNLKQQIHDDFSQSRTSILSEYIASGKTNRILFQLSKKFEALAMAQHSFELPEDSDVKSFLFCLLDYWNINRTDFCNKLP